MKRAAFFLVALAFCLTCCAKKPAPSGTVGARAPMRVVSLSPSTTETMFVLGAGADLVGRSRYCDWPPEVTKLPQVGGYVDPSLEAILALSPTLVVGARGPAGSAITERLESRGVKTYFPEIESFAAIEAMILGIGERAGRPAEARASVDKMRAREKEIAAAVAASPKTRVLLVFGLSPLVVAGPTSFADEMIRRAGGTNVVTDGGAYPTIGVERVLGADPDVVVNAAIAEAHGHERLGPDSPGWGKVRAVTQGRVVAITDESVLRPGPRVADGVATLARAIHPEAKIP